MTKTRRFFFFPFSAMLLFCSCTSLSFHKALWLHDNLDDLKDCNPRLYQKGIYRVVTCTEESKAPACAAGEKEYEEFISYCNPEIKNYIAIHKDDLIK